MTNKIISGDIVSKDGNIGLVTGWTGGKIGNVDNTECGVMMRMSPDGPFQQYWIPATKLLNEFTYIGKLESLIPTTDA